jgi:isoquinoline 1-oxidoreductase beta subunit
MIEICKHKSGILVEKSGIYIPHLPKKKANLLITKIKLRTTMNNDKNALDRRSFLKASLMSGGGLMLTVSWLSSFKSAEKVESLNLREQWTQLNGYIQITPDNKVKLICPNPEFGQNVMTSLPMIVAEELDVDWKNVTVEMGPHDPVKLGAQFTGGSNSVRMYWKPLRQAGATARQMLREAAAQTWNVPVNEVTAKAGILSHSNGKSARYGDVASKAAAIPVPKDVVLKEPKDFTIVRKSKKNVEVQKIVSGSSGSIIAWRAC